MKYIAICGTVGSGKTTLLSRLIGRLGSRAAWHEERPQDNPFITDYYADTKRWTFHAQVSFLALYFDRPKWREETAELFFFDRCFLENLVIAQYRRDQGDMTEDEYRTLCQLANGVSALMPEIDKYIYLDCSIGTILEHIRAAAARMRTILTSCTSMSSRRSTTSGPRRSRRKKRSSSTWTKENTISMRS